MFKKIIIISAMLSQILPFHNSEGTPENVSEDTLLVSISNEESLKFINYKKEDFYKNNIIEIKDLTSSYKESILNKSYKKQDDFHRIYQVKIDDSNTNVLEMKKKIESNDFVDGVSFNYCMTIASTNVNDEYSNQQWALDKIQLKDAWDLEKGDESIKIGILDTGIDITHPDLIGRVDEELSRSFVLPSNGSALEDDLGHGTHVAGIIGAQPNDNEFIAGVCWEVNLVSLKVVNLNNEAWNSNVAEAINYANQHNIELLNISISSEFYSLAIQNSINNFPGLIVCCSGNSNQNTDINNTYLNQYDNDNIICVGNSNELDLVGPGSNYGKITVDLFAPGTEIISDIPLTVDNERVATWTGTSMATPYVTGVAALIKAQNPSLTWSQVKRRILENVDHIAAFTDLCVTGGRLNALKALTNVQHVHNNVVELYDNDYHTLYCEPCGNYTYEEHIWVLYYNSLNTIDCETKGLLKRYRCSVCGLSLMF